MNNFYIITGNISEVRPYLVRLGYRELKQIGNDVSIIIISNCKKLFWTVGKQWKQHAMREIRYGINEIFIRTDFDTFKDHMEVENEEVIFETIKT